MVGGTVVETLEFVKAGWQAQVLDSTGLYERPFQSKNSHLKHQARRNMESPEHWPLLTPLIGQVVVVDLKSSYVCLGTLVKCDQQFLELMDADLHDFRDSPATREVYVYDSVRIGIRRNRARVLIRQDDVVAVTRFSDISSS